MKRLTLLACCISALAFAPLRAQQFNEQDTAAIRQQFRLEEVQVISSPRVFANQVIEKKQAQLQVENIGQNLPYLISNTPSLVATSDDGLGIGYTYFHIRGTDHTRINMTLNDVPLNDPESQTVFWVNMTDMASSLTNMKVQRGVGTSLSGSSAFGASLNMTSLFDTNLLTNKPVRAELSFTGGMYNTFHENLQIYARFGNWHLGGRVSKTNSDGYIERAASDLISYQTEIGWQSTAKDNGEKTEVTLLGFGGKERSYMAWYGIDESTMNWNRRFNPAGLVGYVNSNGDTATIAYPNQADHYSQHHAQLHIKHRFNYHWTMRAIAHYTYGTGYYEMADYATYSDLTGWSGITQDGLTNHTAGAHLQAQYIGDIWSAVFGMAGQFYTCDHWGKLDLMNTYLGYGKKTDANIYAKFSEYLLHTADSRLTLYEDLQYRFVDHHMSGNLDYVYPVSDIDIRRTNHFFNPKVGLEYFQSGHQLTASFAMANREPTRANYVQGVFDNAMPRPEQLLDYELGYNFTFSPAQTGASQISGSVGANLYFMQYNDQLVATGKVDVNNYVILTNIKTSYRTGIELQYTLNFTPWMTFDGNLVWSRNRWKVANNQWSTLSFSPDRTAYNALDFHAAGFCGIINNQVVSAQYLTNDQDATARLKAYTVTNIHLSYILPIKNPNAPQIKLRCQLNNIFNSMYCSNGGSADGYTYYFPQAGFNCHAGFTLTF